MIEPALGLRERKKAEARDALIEAAVGLCTEHGFDGVTVEQIAERANVSRRTFFRYFATKEAALTDRRSAQLATFRTFLAGVAAGVSIERGLEDAFELLAADYEAQRARIWSERRLFLAHDSLAVADLQLDREIEEAIASFTEKRLPRTDRERRRARLFAASVVGMLRVVIGEWAESRGKKPLRELGRDALDRALRILA